MKADEIVKVIRAAAKGNVASITIGDVNIVFNIPVQAAPMQTIRVAASKSEASAKEQSARKPQEPAEENEEERLEKLFFEDFDEFERQAIMKSGSA